MYHFRQIDQPSLLRLSRHPAFLCGTVEGPLVYRLSNPCQPGEPKIFTQSSSQLSSAQTDVRLETRPEIAGFPNWERHCIAPASRVNPLSQKSSFCLPLCLSGLFLRHFCPPPGPKIHRNCLASYPLGIGIGGPSVCGERS